MIEWRDIELDRLHRAQRMDEADRERLAVLARPHSRRALDASRAVRLALGRWLVAVGGRLLAGHNANGTRYNKAHRPIV